MDDGDWGEFGSLEGFLEHDEAVYDAVAAETVVASRRAWMDSHLLAYAASSASVAPVVSQQDLRGLMARAIRPRGRASRRVVVASPGSASAGSSGDGSRPRPDAVALAADLLAAAGVSR